MIDQFAKLVRYYIRNEHLLFVDVFTKLKQRQDASP